MSDYLSDLAARSLASTEVILPRLASRFEPSPAGGLLNRAPASRIDGPAVGMEDLAEVPTELALPASRRRMAWEVDALTASSRAASVSGQLRDEAGADAAGSWRKPGMQDTQLGTIIVPVTQTASWPGHSLEPVRPVVRPGFAEGIHPSLGEPAPALRKGEIIGPAELEVGKPVGPPDRLFPVSNDLGLDDRIRSAVGDALVWELAQLSAENHPTPARKDAAPEVQPAAPARVLTRPQVAIAAPARPAALDGAEAGKLKTQQEQPLPAPTIHVTIGRIEVRATPAPVSASSSKPRTAPTMSLDDYLRQRNRGDQ